MKTQRFKTTYFNTKEGDYYDTKDQRLGVRSFKVSFERCKRIRYKRSYEGPSLKFGKGEKSS